MLGVTQEKVPGTLADPLVNFSTSSFWPKVRAEMVGRLEMTGVALVTTRETLVVIGER